MGKSKYVDVSAIIQVIGGIYKNPSLLEQEQYNFNEEDFPEKFHRILFGSMYNLYNLGVKKFSINNIEDYLEKQPKAYAIYKSNNGQEYLKNLIDTTTLQAFDYYYNKMKKMTLLRMYDQCGVDLSFIYDIDNAFDLTKREKQEEWLNNATLDDIADEIDKKISAIRMTYINNEDTAFIHAGEGIFDFLQQRKEQPDVGYPLFGPLINGVTRGARLKKFYIRSAGTGVGKTRSMIADACYIGCKEIYNLETNQWESTGVPQPTLYITTEQDKEEVDSMMLAFLSGVDESHISKNQFLDGEEERLAYAAKLLQESKLYIKLLPDFSLQDIENTIRYSVREYKVQYVFFDYIHSSMKILAEIGSKAKVKGLREDNILFMISVRLKDLCNKYGIFILTGTQLNGEYRNAEEYDQNLLRGAKAIADKCDLGEIMLEVTQDDRQALLDLLNTNNLEMPVIKMSIYKNRGNKYKNILLWCRANRGICRIEPLFATNYQYELVEIEDFQISVKDEESAF